MKYKFRCPQCREDHEVELSMEECEKYDAVCKRCKVKLERVYEMPQVKGGQEKGGLVKGSDDASSGDGPDSLSDMSCGGSCSSCTSCGM